MTTSIPPSAETARPSRPPRVRLGEELPVFCEKCGYSLHGLPQVRCERCDLLQFHCPECGHHQAINTLRPAFQKVLGRASAAILAAVVLVKAFALFWCFAGWWLVGYEVTCRYDYEHGYSQMSPASGPRYLPAQLDIESVLIFTLFGLAFGLVARMLLLRWRRGYLVGAVVAALAILTVVLAGWFRRWELADRRDVPLIPALWNYNLLVLLALGASAIAAGASIAFGLWSGLVHLLLPRDRARVVLDWQCGRSTQAAALART